MSLKSDDKYFRISGIPSSNLSTPGGSWFLGHKKGGSWLLGREGGGSWFPGHGDRGCPGSLDMREVVPCAPEMKAGGPVSLNMRLEGPGHGGGFLVP